MRTPAFEIVRLSGDALLRFSDGPNPVELTAWKYADSLTGFARAVSALTRGWTEATVAFVAEIENGPGHTRVRMTLDGAVVRLEFTTFPDTVTAGDDEGAPGDTLFVDAQHFFRSVAAAYRRALAAHGPEGYKNLWGHPPPLVAIDDIERMTGLTGKRYW